MTMGGLKAMMSLATKYCWMLCRMISSAAVNCNVKAFQRLAGDTQTASKPELSCWVLEKCSRVSGAAN